MTKLKDPVRRTDYMGTTGGKVTHATGRSWMPFGKFQGRQVRELPDSYLGWLAGITIHDPKLAKAVRSELERRER